MRDQEKIALNFKKSRINSGLSLKDASAKTGISQKYLEAIERGDWHKLPEGVYHRNFLREYAYYLKQNTEILENYFLQEDQKQVGRSSRFFSKQIIPGRFFWTLPKMVKNLIIMVIAIIFFTYLFQSYKMINTPPYLTIANPQDNLITDKREINFIGQTEKEAQVTINGIAVLSSKEGFFNEKINLKNGINIITISAKKKYGQESVIKKQILVKS